MDRQKEGVKDGWMKEQMDRWIDGGTKGWLRDGRVGG